LVEVVQIVYDDLVPQFRARWWQNRLPLIAVLFFTAVLTVFALSRNEFRQLLVFPAG
jgi:hypothetical protein